MSVLEQAFGAIKNAMLIQERFDRLEDDLKDLSRDLSDLGDSHGRLAERVARLEGIIQGAAMASGREPPRIEG